MRTLGCHIIDGMTNKQLRSCKHDVRVVFFSCAVNAIHTLSERFPVLACQAQKVVAKYSTAAAAGYS